VEIVRQHGISNRLYELVKNLTELVSEKNAGKSEIELPTVEFVTPLSILPLAAYGNQYGVTINCTEDPNSEACGYLNAISFQKGAQHFHRRDKGYLPIMKRPAIREDDLLTEYEAGIFLRANLPEAYGLLNSLNVLTSEVVANVRQHAKIGYYWILAQYYERASNLCEIVIADNGRGYKKSFEGTKFKVETDAEAIQNAFEGKSSKPPKSDLMPRGYGIRHIADAFINRFHGKLIIISGKSVQYYKENTSKEIPLPRGWPGSIVCVNFNARDIDALDDMPD
jgi:hypothetical protein